MGPQSNRAFKGQEHYGITYHGGTCFNFIHEPQATMHITTIRAPFKWLNLHSDQTTEHALMRLNNFESLSRSCCWKPVNGASINESNILENLWIITYPALLSPSCKYNNSRKSQNKLIINRNTEAI